MEARVLSLVGELIGVLDLEEFPQALMSALREAVPADYGALNEVPALPPHPISLTDPPVPAEMHELFARYATQNPVAAHFLKRSDGRATRISDLVSRRELQRLELYRYVYAPLGVEYQIAFTLPSSGDRILGASLSRTKRNFTARERDLLNLARPYLIEVYRNALLHSAAVERGREAIALPALEGLGLTGRQAEVLRLIATGHSAAEAGHTLGLSARTVQKHLEFCYRRLGVRSRSEAAAWAWAAAAG